MDSIRINTGIVRLMIDDDPERVIAFNPEDVAFAEAFFNLYDDINRKQAELEAHAKEIAENGKTDEVGMPINAGDHIALLRDLIQYMRDGIDDVFGPGTSQTAFGNVYSLNSLISFIEGVTPYIEKARENKVSAYIKKSGRKVLK